MNENEYRFPFLLLFFLSLDVIRCMQYVYFTSTGYGQNQYAKWKYALCAGSPNTIQNWRGKFRYILQSHQLHNISIPLFFQTKSYYRGLLFPLCSTGFLNSIIFGVYGNSFRIYQNMYVISIGGKNFIHCDFRFHFSRLCVVLCFLFRTTGRQVTNQSKNIGSHMYLWLDVRAVWWKQFLHAQSNCQRCDCRWK